MFGGFGASKTKDKNDDLANLIEAVNTEEGITALGGISSKPTPPPSSASALTEEKPKTLDPVLQRIFEDDKDDDYLILPGAEKVRPRSQYFTHTVGMAVAIGGLTGGMSGGIRHASPQLAKEAAARTEFLTRIIRSSRNNAIRFGIFSTVMAGAAILAENIVHSSINSDIDQTLPTEEEIMEMQIKGIQYQPPELRPVPLETQKIITTFGIYTAGVGLALPKSWDLWKKSKIVKDMASASKDSGDVEKWFLNRFGTGSKGHVQSGNLPKIMRQLAVGRIAGIVCFCTLIDQMWRHQRETANTLIRNATSSSNRLF